MSYVSHAWQRIRTPSAPVGGDTLTISTAYQSFATTVSIPASAWIALRSFRFRCRGVVNSSISLNIQAALFLNSTQIVASPAVSVSVLSNAGWRGDLEIDVMTAGASSVLEVQGEALFGMAAVTDFTAGLTNTGTINNVDLTADQTLSLKIKGISILGTSTIQLRKMICEATMIN